jgi:5'-methylthioadenosine phosphorylase
MTNCNDEISAVVGVIGGSGVYEIEGIEQLREIKIKTPFGDTSDAITVGVLNGVKCAFLPRHGRGHRLTPTEIPVRANIWALKSLGVEKILAISACGSLKEEIKPKTFCIPDQIFDRTVHRTSTFFGDGVVAHVGVAEPFCEGLRNILLEGVKELGIEHTFGGTYVCMEGPQFSTKAESQVNRSHGFSVIGMTAAPEAKLAREAEMCYATVGLVTDYDVWKEGEEVTVEKVLEVMAANVANAKKLIKNVITKFAADKKPCACQSALKYAIMTNPSVIPQETYNKLELLIGKYIIKK